jgi:hypothetical protein
MKKPVALLILLLAVGVACEKGSLSPINGSEKGSAPSSGEKPIPPGASDGVVEGTVRYYPALAAIGGESDPSGFILISYVWVSEAPTYSHSRVYVKGAIDSSYLNLRVRVTGPVETLRAGGVETPLRYFPRVEAQKLEVLE